MANMLHRHPYLYIHMFTCSAERPHDVGVCGKKITLANYLRYPDTPELCIYLLKQNRVIIPDEISENNPGKNIYRDDYKFKDRSSGQTVQSVILLFDIDVQGRCTCRISHLNNEK